LAQAIDDERGGKPVRHVINEGDKGDEAKAFWTAIGGEGAVGADTGDDEAWEKKPAKFCFTSVMNLAKMSSPRKVKANLPRKILIPRMLS